MPFACGKKARYERVQRPPEARASVLFTRYIVLVDSFFLRVYEEICSTSFFKFSSIAKFLNTYVYMHVWDTRLSVAQHRCCCFCTSSRCCVVAYRKYMNVLNLGSNWLHVIFLMRMLDVLQFRFDQRIRWTHPRATEIPLPVLFEYNLCFCACCVASWLCFLIQWVQFSWWASRINIALASVILIVKKKTLRTYVR